jgi:phosphatidylinositol glycan class V
MKRREDHDRRMRDKGEAGGEKRRGLGLQIRFQNQVDSICCRPTMTTTTNPLSAADDNSISLNIHKSLALTRRRLILRAVGIRLLVVLLMSLSCRLFQTASLHTTIPKDDSVVSFDLRINDDSCFAMQGSFCHCGFDSAATSCGWNSSDDSNDTSCASPSAPFTDSSPSQSFATRNLLQQYIYPFVLTPLTRWDAARFLRLAHRPQLYLPRPLRARQDHSAINDDNSHTTTHIDDAFIESEQAHVFFKVFPRCIQLVAWLLLYLSPPSLLPNTCEQTLVLAALLLNLLCHTMAALVLFQLTYNLLLLLQRQQSPDSRDELPSASEYATKKKNDDFRANDEDLNERSIQHRLCLQWATRTTLLFLVQPASVFVSAAYSESLFGLLILLGCLSFQQSRQHHSGFPSLLYSLLARLCWILAACTRSNGVLYFGFVLLADVGTAIALWKRQRWIRGCWRVILALATAQLSLMATLHRHNRQGIRNHCCADVVDDEDSESWSCKTTVTIVSSMLLGDSLHTCSPALHRPNWCQDAIPHHGNASFPYDALSLLRPPFSLYSYIQRKYWNVGLLRYYTFRQLPNFVLATPIIVIALCGTARWIQTSWKSKKFGRVYATSERRTSPMNQVVGWAIDSLQEFGAPLSIKDSSASASSMSHEQFLTGSNHVLGHYAVLCVATLVGLLVAHVQITTRMVCSTCPALYWYMAVLVAPSNTKANESCAVANERSMRLRSHVGEAVLGYCLLYNLLGILLYPNWLPWT